MRNTPTLSSKTRAQQPRCIRTIQALALAVLAGTIALAPGCQRGEDFSTDVSTEPMGQVASQRIAGVLQQTLDQADLHLAWSAKIPMGRAKGFKSIFYHEARLFAISDQNDLYAIDAQTSAILWWTRLGDIEPSCSMPSYFQDRMLFVVGNDLVEVRQTDGKLTFPNGRIELRFPVVTTAVRTEKYVFVGGANRRFYCLSLPNAIHVWQSVCPAEPVGPIAIDEQNVYFAGRDGKVYCSRISQRELVWEAQTAGLMPGVVVDSGQCFAPSTDTAIYGFDASTGTPLWTKCLTGGPLLDMPAITKQAIYQPVWQKGLVCVDRRTGKTQWELPGGECLIAEDSERTYVMTLDKELTIIENRTGQPAISFLIKQADLCVINTEDEMIFLAQNDGTLWALAPDK